MSATKTFLTAVALALTAVFVAPVAQAGETQYLNEVAASTPMNRKLTRDQALALGNTACQAIRSAVAGGMPLAKARSQADDAVGRASQRMGLGLGLGDGMSLVSAAERQLC